LNLADRTKLNIVAEAGNQRKAASSSRTCSRRRIAGGTRKMTAHRERSDGDAGGGYSSALCSPVRGWVPFWIGWATAPCALCHISRPTNVENSEGHEQKKKTRKSGIDC